MCSTVVRRDCDHIHRQIVSHRSISGLTRPDPTRPDLAWPGLAWPDVTTMRRTLGTGETVIPATFELVYMIGWAPGADQPAALERGTATTSLTDVLVR
jgi:hypothetical protein